MENETQTFQEQLDEFLMKILKKEEHLSFSSLKAFMKSPKDFIDYKFAERKSTKSMDLGTLVHLLVLEPTKFEERYAILPDDAPKKPSITQINAKKPSDDTLKAIAYWNEFEVNNKHKTIISKSDLLDAQSITNNIKFNNSASNILNKCNEYEIPLDFEYNNFRFKGYVDANGENIRADLKIYASSEPRKFQRDAFANSLHVQASIYNIGLGNVPYYLISADKSGGVSTHKISLELIEYGKKQLDNILEEFNRCILENKWHQSYDFYSQRYDGTYIFDRPAYAY